MTPDVAITKGEHNVTATQLGENGVTSAVSPIDELKVDTIAPDAPTVVITEDTNNDGKISEMNELDGLVDVNITLPADAEVGDTLNITNPDGTTTTVPVTQTMIDNGYQTTYPVPTYATPMQISASVTDAVGNKGAEGSDSALLAPTAPAITSIDENTSTSVET